MPLTSQTPRAPAKKKKSKKERKATQEAPARASSPVPGKSKTSGRKFQTVALTISEDASRAVINRLPPSAPPEDLEEFDQNRWLEQQLALTQQMMQLYTEDGSGNTACPYIGGAADEDDDSDDGWREDEEAAEALKSAEQRQHDLTQQMQQLYSDDGGGLGAQEESEEEGEEEDEDEDEEGEEAAEASGSAGTSVATTLRSSARARRHQAEATKRPEMAQAAVDSVLQKAARKFDDGELEAFSPFCVGRQAVAFPEIEITLPAGRLQHGLFDRGSS